ncbi:hypothetical protein MNBD_NITROSPINAE04-1617 [hydrothermal vent metagenome]|uniref:Uncharacterized protein n=1 Tax=hydrothermal vent metagenome TaxID=652676 RepID=A0A3B1CDJ2_9ZZZZ
MVDDHQSAGKWAKELKVSDKKFKDALKESGIKPDSQKGACKYYSKKTAEKIKKKIK